MIKNLINKDVALYIILLVMVIAFGLSKIFPEFGKLTSTMQQITEIKPQIEQFEVAKQNQMLNEQREKQQEAAQALPIEIYSTQYSGLTVENASVDLIDDIIAMMKSTNNLVTEISYDPGVPIDANNPNLKNYSQLKMKFQITGTYMNLQNLLQKLYTWSYLAKINNITISPDPNNRKNLNTSLELQLYIKNS